MTVDNEEINLMINDCIRRVNKLTDWEKDFMRSLSKVDSPLSDKQIKIINEIWDRVT